ncbi:MAG TPA: tyrosine--tRNA ligase, partial [Anaerolineae bacterium]|nr:tyrosine--tRNA ligase [Anaerolineae bacterium]
QEALGQRPLVGIITGILPGTDGVQRMSKSTGNIVPIHTTAEDMYGKIMSVPDFAMVKYMTLVTRWMPDVIAAKEAKLNRGAIHPRDLKMELAREITSIFYGDEAARAAEHAFVSVFQQHALPDEMEEVKIAQPMNLTDLLIHTQAAKSKNEARRLIDQGGVKLDGEVLSGATTMVEVTAPKVLQVGKRKFVRLIP